MGTNIQDTCAELVEALAKDADTSTTLSTSNEYAMIDATIVRAHQHSSGAKGSCAEQEAIGRGVGGLSTNGSTSSPQEFMPS